MSEHEARTWKAAAYDRFRTCLEEIDKMLDSFPSGVEEDADPMDKSPEDAVSHLAGLIRKKIREVLR